MVQGSEVELLCLFEVGQDSVDLLGEFKVAHTGTPQNLQAEFIVRNESSQEFLGEFHVGQDSVDLLGEFHVGQDAVSLLGEFVVTQWQGLLIGEFIVRHTVTTVLPAEFSIPTSEVLQAEFIVRHNSIIGPDNWIPCEVYLIRTWAALQCEFTVRFDGAEDLLGEFIVQNENSADLLGEFIIRQSGHADQGPLSVIIRNADSVELLGEFEIAHWEDLQAEFVVTPAAPPIFDCEQVMREDDWDEWINYYDCIDSGFISEPIAVDDAAIKKSGVNSFRITSTYTSRKFKEIRFGWSGVKRFNSCLCPEAVNFFNFIEVDPSSDIAVKVRELEFQEMRLCDEARIYYDYGIDYFDGNYRFKVGFKVIDIVGQWAGFSPWQLQDSATFDDMITDKVYLYRQADGSIRFYLYSSTTGEREVSDYTDLLQYNTEYWLDIERTGAAPTNISCKIYSHESLDPAYLVDTLSIICTDGPVDWKNSLRYAFALENRKAAQCDRTATGYVKCFEVVEVE